MALTLGAIMALVVGTIVFFALKSFVKKWGENLATKTDIGVITKLQEGIKQEIALASENRLSFQVMKREAIIGFYEKYNNWITYLWALRIIDDNEAVVHNKLEVLNIEFSNSQSRFQLFVEEFSKYEDQIMEIFKYAATIEHEYYLAYKAYHTSPLDQRHAILSKFIDFRLAEYGKILLISDQLTVEFRSMIRNSLV